MLIAVRVASFAVGPAGNAIRPLPSLGCTGLRVQRISRHGLKPHRFQPLQCGTDQNALNKTKAASSCHTSKVDMRMERWPAFWRRCASCSPLLKPPSSTRTCRKWWPSMASSCRSTPSEFRQPAPRQDQRWPWHRLQGAAGAANHGPVADLMMGAQFLGPAPQHISEAIRLYVEAMEFDPGAVRVARTHWDAAQSAGFPADAAPAAAADGRIARAGAAVAQENQALKVEPASRDGEHAPAAKARN